MRSIPVLGIILVIGVLAALPGCKTAETAGGKLYFSQGLYDKAIAQLEPAVEQKPADYEAWFWLGKSYAEVGRYADAARAFEQAAKGPKQKKDVENAREHYWIDQFNKGIGYIKEAETGGEVGRSKFDDALKAFENSIQLKPAEARGYIYKGFTLNKLDRSADALAMYEKAMELAPDDEQARNNLFQTFKDLGNKALDQKSAAGYDDAVRYYSKALEIEPNDTPVLFAAATAHYELGLADSTRAAAEHAAAADAYKKVLGLLDQEKQKVEGDAGMDAAQKQQRLEQNRRDTEDTLFNLNLVELQMGDEAGAEESARRFVALDPRKPDGHKLLGRVHARRGDQMAAFAELIVATSLEKGNQISVDGLEAEVKKNYGGASDALGTIKEKGVPQEVRSHDEGGVKVDTWFYWSRGEALAFSNGRRLATVSFEPVKGS